MITLERHHISLNGQDVSFFTYCEDAIDRRPGTAAATAATVQGTLRVTPLYYELGPFAAAMKFVQPDQILQSVPAVWARTGHQLSQDRAKERRSDDPTDGALDRLLDQYKIAPSALFGEFSAIVYLCGLVTKNQQLWAVPLHRECLRRIEHDRMVAYARAVGTLQQRVDGLVVQVDSIRAHLVSLMSPVTQVLTTMVELAKKMGVTGGGTKSAAAATAVTTTQ